MDNSNHQPATTLSVADYQEKYDEISAILKAAKNDFSMPNAEKRRIAKEHKAVANELRAASKAAEASAAQAPTTASKVP